MEKNELVRLWQRFEEKRDPVILLLYLQELVKKYQGCVDREYKHVGELPEEGPHLFTLPENLLDECERILKAAAQRSTTTQLRTTIYAQVETVLIALTVVCRNLDNIAFVSSCSIVRYVVELASSAFIQMLQNTSLLPEDKSVLLSFISSTCHLLEVLYDPYLIWRAWLQRNVIHPSQFQFQPSLLHLEVVPFLYDSLHCQPNRLPLSLQLHLLNVFGAIVAGAQHNALCATTPATMEVLLSVVLEVSLKEHVRTVALQAVAYSLLCMQNAKAHQRQVDVTSVLHQVLRSVLRLCRPLTPASLCPLYGLKDLLWRMGDLPLCKVMLEDDTLQTLFQLLQQVKSSQPIQNNTNLSVEDHVKIVVAILDIATAFIAKGAWAKNHFLSAVGFDAVAALVLPLGIPQEPLLRSLLCMATEQASDDSDDEEGREVCHGPVIHLLLCLLPEVTDSETQAWLCERLLELCLGRLNAQMACCQAGVVKDILKLLERHTLLCGKAIGKLLRLLEILGSHSLHSLELKQIFLLLRLDSHDKQFAYTVPMIHVLSSMAKQSGWLGAPHHFFIISNQNDGLSIPSGIRQWPGTGFAFHSWLRLDKVSVPVKADKTGASSNLYRRQLYSFLTKYGCGFEAFFTEEYNLVVAVATKKEFHAAAVLENPLDDGKWHCVSICQSPARRPFTNSSITVYIDGRQRLTAQLKFPTLTEQFVYCRVGSGGHHQQVPWLSPTEENGGGSGAERSGSFIGTIGDAAWGQISTFIDKDKLVALGSKSLPFRNSLSLLQTEPDPSVQNCSLGAQDGIWGAPQCLQGQLGAICIFQEALSSSQVKWLFDSGPSCLSLLSDEHAEAIDLQSKLLLCWDAQACHDEVCCDLAPQHLYEGHLSGGGSSSSTNLKEALNCLGGMSCLYPLLEQVGKESNSKCQDFSGLSPQRPQPLSHQASFDDSGDEWVVLPTSSYSEWKLEQNPVAGFLLLLLHLVQGHPHNQEQLLGPNGLHIVGALLHKVPDNLVDVSVLMATQLLVEGSTGCENASELLKALYQFILFEFRIWSKGSFPVRIGHIQYLSTIIKDDRKFFRRKYGPQFFLDIIQQFYSNCPSLSSEDSKTIRVSLFGIVKYYMSREVNIHEISAVISFIITLKNEEMVSESLDMLQSLLESPSARDQLFLLLYEPSSAELLYGLLFNVNFTAVLKSKAIKVLGLLLWTDRVYEKNKTRMRLHDLGFSSLTSLLSPQHVSPQMVALLMDQTLMLDVPAAYQGALTLLHFIRHMKASVKLDAVKKFLTALESRSVSSCIQVCRQIGWQECVLSLLVKQPMAGSRTVPATPLPSLDLMDFSLDAVEMTSETDVKSDASPALSRSNTRRLSRRSSSSLRSLEGSGSSDSTTLPPRTPQFLLQLKEHIFDFDLPQILGRSRSGSQSSSLEDLVVASGNGDSSPLNVVAKQRSSLAAELDRLLSDPARNNNQDSVSSSVAKLNSGEEEELCSIVCQLAHLLFWKGVEGSGKAAWQERGHMLACINLLALSNDLFQSHLEIKRTLLEKALQSCLNDLQEAGQANATHTENAMELMKLVYDLVVLENTDDNRRLSEKLLEGVLLLLDVLLVFGEHSGGQDGWTEMAEMGLGIVLVCSATENLELCAMSTAKLHALVQTRPFASLEEACHLLATLDNILNKSLDTGDQEHYSFLIPVVRALLEKLAPPLHLQRHLPTLPLSSPGPAFFEDFQHYALCSEWKTFIEKVIRPLARKYTCLRIDEQRDTMNGFWNQCYESVMVALHKRSREIGESKLRFQANVMEVFASKSSEEQTRYASVLTCQRHQHLLIQKRWRMLKLYLYGPTGPWETRSPIIHHWKLSNHENHSRMRLKLSFHLNFDPHHQASRLRDNQGSASGIPAGSTVNCGLPLVAPKVQQQQDDSLGEEDLLISATQMEIAESAEKEKTIISEDCELITLMSVVKGRLELTMSDIYFFDLSPFKDEGERNDFKCPLSTMREVHLRRYNLRRSALEFFLIDQTNIFLNFTPKSRNKIFSRILSLRPPNLIYTHGIRSPAELLKASGLTQKWVNREISNFEYLMHLNTIAGRTYNDLSQYPVFPWIICDYSSSVLDLNNPAIYRDLSKPIAVVNQKNIPEVKAKYENFVDILGVVEKFHYGTHYSNSAGVLHYLVRMEPFTSLHIDLQSGRFDVADRQFHSLEATWRLLMENPNDCKELIPEFFYLPEFLLNMNGFDLGRLQISKERVDDVRLPPWASSPEEFIYLHRKALESDHVSSNLHKWIDLIFGYKQKGPAAVEALNVFYYVSYEGAIDLEAIVDPVERAATEGMINNFGQTPCQLLKESHPKRLDWKDLLTRQGKNDVKPVSLFLFLDNLRTFFVEASITSSPVIFMCLPQGQQQQYQQSPQLSKSFRVATTCEPLVTVCQKGILAVHGWLPFDKTKTIPYYYTFERDPALNSNKTLRKLGGPFHPSITVTHRLFAVTLDAKLVISGGHWDNSIHVFSIVKGRNICTLQSHLDVVTCLALDAGGKHFISGSRDTTCMVWEIKQLNTGPSVVQSPLQRLFGHDCEITCAALAMDLDLAISGSKDGSVNLYTVREGYFTRTVSPPCGQPTNQMVALLCLSSVGHLCVYAQPKDADKGGEHCLHLYSINGKYLGGRSASGPLSSMTLAGNYLVTGSLDGVVTVYETFGLQQRCSIPLHIPVMTVCVTSGYSHLLASLDDGKVIIIGISRPSSS